MLKYFKIVLTSFCLLIWASVAIAIVSFNISNGTGYVDSADVKAAYRWSETDMRNRVWQLRFFLQKTNTYKVITSNNTVNSILQNVKYDVISVPDYAVSKNDPNFNGRFLGYKLTGYVYPQGSADVATPIIGDIYKNSIVIDVALVKTNNNFFAIYYIIPTTTDPNPTPIIKELKFK